ncbi:MAG: hypothetical protein LBV80_06925 [Deltaproteobacteria bacterium]|jgi:hypothetical protein|nr:hypothetical protein [Deltaproteobacteria bacterium]
MQKAFFINPVPVLIVLAALILFFSQPAQAAQSTPEFESVNGAWVVDSEATAKVYQVPQDLNKSLDGLTISFDIKNNRLSATWADGSRVSHAYKVTPNGAGKANLRISNKYDMTLDFSQADVLVLTENNNSLVLKRAAVKL